MNLFQRILPVFICLIYYLPQSSGQGLRFDKYPEKKWPNGIVPFTINALDFSVAETTTITLAVANIALNTCVKFVPRVLQDDYVHIYKENECSSSAIGKAGGQQNISLADGCVTQGIILQEFLQVLGFALEHNRLDRDNYVEVLWDNIPDVWKDKYNKTDPNDYGLQGRYDYYSIMHYPYYAPGTNKPAFFIRQNGIDRTRMGRGKSLTPNDVNMVNELYENCT